ncbi:MAG: hypothetical protein ACK5LF_14600 [Bacteroides xylanisolvens]
MEQFFVDSIDIFRQYGIVITEGSYKSIASFASLKDIDYNDWPEEDGIEPDLSSPALDSRNLTIMFGCLDNSITDDFINLLSDMAYHEFTFTYIDKSLRLRLFSMPSKDMIGKSESFSLQFVDDFPLKDYVYQAPLSGSVMIGYSLDDKSFSDYGIWILEGSDNEIMKTPDVKDKLKISSKYISGSIYDDKDVTYKQKDVTLSLGIIRMDVATFWRNYYAFLFDLIRPNERQFTVDKFSDTFSCYYKSSSVSEFIISNGYIWCKFSITLCFTNFRPKRAYSLWSTEDERIIITEDEINAIIK